MSSNENQVKSLLDICQDHLRKHVIGKIDTLYVLEAANELDLKELQADCIRTIRFKYDFFKDITEEGYLRYLLGEDEVHSMERNSIARQKFKRYIKQEGKVLEHAAPATAGENAQAYDAEGNRNYFPIEALVTGVKWPEGVDPSKREEWLSDEEFQRVFKMNKEQFRTLKTFHKERLKKQAMLW